MSEIEKTDNLDQWLPRQMDAPVVFKGQRLILREVSLLQRDRVIQIIKLALVDGMRAAAEAKVVDTDEAGNAAFKPSAALRGLLQGMEGGQVSQSLEKLVELIGDVLGGKLTDMVCAVLCNLHNAAIVLGDSEDLGDVLTDEIANQVSRKLASEITPRQEVEVLRLWVNEVERLGELLGNWKALLPGMSDDSSENPDQTQPTSDSVD